MTVLDKIFHRHGKGEEGSQSAEPSDLKTKADKEQECVQQEPAPNDDSARGPQPPSYDENAAPASAAGGMRAPQPMPPSGQVASQFTNAGQQVGMAASMIPGSDVGMGAGIVDGGVAGNFIGQRIHQAQNHTYWSERAAEYQAGNKEAAQDPRYPDADVDDSGRAGRAARRAAKREERWDKRAAR